MGDSYKVGQGFAGPDMKVEGNTVNFQGVWDQAGGNVDFDAVSAELVKARDHIEKLPKTDETYEAISALTDAKREATRKDGPKLLEKLKALPAAAVEATKEVAAMTLAELIKSTIGIPG